MPQKLQGLRCVLFVRTPRRWQKDGAVPDRFELRNFAKHTDMEVVGELIVNSFKGRTVTSQVHAATEELIKRKTVHDDDFDCVLMRSLNRLGRDVDLLWAFHLIHKLNTLGISVVTLKEGFINLTPHARSEAHDQAESVANSGF